MDAHGHPALVDHAILARADAQPDRPAVADAHSGRGLTFGQLADGARRLAGGLRRQGIGRGDAVGVVAGNTADHAVVLYGVLAAGAAVASSNPALTAGELARQLAVTRPRLVIADEQSRDAVTAAAADSGIAVHAIDALADLLAAPLPEAHDRVGSDVAHLIPSSGTTGLPKIAVHDHAGTTAALRALTAVPSVALGPQDVVAIVIPFTHLFGTAFLHHALHNGAAVTTLSLAGFDLEAFLRMLQDHAVTVAPVTPPVLRALARHPLVDRYDLSSLRQLICSAAPCPVDLQDTAAERLGCVVTDNLGTTEAWGVALSAVPPARGSVGRMVPGLDAVIVDPDSGARLAAGEVGELWVRGPAVMRGYLDGDAPLDADGWLRTGDLCWFDRDANLYVVDRLKDVIKVGGYSVAPAEIELELVRHPAVADVAVVGRADPALGEIPVAYVALHGPPTPDELRTWLDGRLAPWKQVGAVVVVERIARSPAGKLLRREAAAQAVG
jgi:acyl-CoA synthetase (AMP-forming)/AMP-acid ligase II